MTQDPLNALKVLSASGKTIETGYEKMKKVPEQQMPPAAAVV